MNARFRVCAFGVVGALAASLTAVTPVPAAAQSSQAQQQDSLRERIAARFEVMALTGGIGLVPRSEDAGVWVIEITDQGVALDGQAVTGQELESRLGADGELVLQLSYLPPNERR